MLYCPAGQGRAVAVEDPAGHRYPELHGPVQLGEEVPGTPYRPAGHWAVHPGLVMALEAPYTPPGHGVQDDAPTGE